MKQKLTIAGVIAGIIIATIVYGIESRVPRTMAAVPVESTPYEVLAEVKVSPGTSVYVFHDRKQGRICYVPLRGGIWCGTIKK